MQTLEEFINERFRRENSSKACGTHNCVRGPYCTQSFEFDGFAPAQPLDFKNPEKFSLYGCPHFLSESNFTSIEAIEAMFAEMTYGINYLEPFIEWQTFTAFCNGFDIRYNNDIYDLVWELGESSHSMNDEENVLIFCGNLDSSL